MPLPFTKAWRELRLQKKQAEQKQAELARLTHRNQLDAIVKAKTDELRRHGFEFIDRPSWPQNLEGMPPWIYYYAVYRGVVYKVTLHHAGGMEIQRA